MNGLRLAEMEVSEMLDVIHYFFEEDYRYTSTDQADFKDNFRQVVYKSLYEVEYAYISNKPKETSYKDFDDNIDGLLEESTDEPPEVIEPFSPRLKKTKDFIEPSIPEENSSRPFGMTLDEPIA